MPDYQWEPVVTKVRRAMLDAFSFERRELGQDVLLSEVFSVMQSVRGVAYVDIDFFGGIPEKKYDEQGVGESKRRLLTPEEITEEVQKTLKKYGQERQPKQRISVNLADFENGSIRPAQLAFLTPDVPETLILNQIIDGKVIQTKQK
ncbi:MAG: hypothetical protein D3906_11670 [Candidatus Electrothrix sp. AUS1_2]|nr:hypothetical protein [Candidatus Electrothrix sp. AUS1_2]